MSDIRIVNIDEIRATVRFDDLIEPMARAFQKSSAGRASNGLIVMFPSSDRCSGVGLGRSKGGKRLRSAQTEHRVLGQGGMQRHRVDPAIDIPLPRVKQATPRGRRRQP